MMRTKKEILERKNQRSNEMQLTDIEEIQAGILEVLIDIRDILADTFHEEHVRVKESD